MSQDDIRSCVVDNSSTHASDVFMPLIAAAFEPGKAQVIVESFSFDSSVHAIAQAELLYFQGDAERCVRMLEPMLADRDEGIALSANLMSAFANLTLGRIGCARSSMATLAAIGGKSQNEFTRTVASLSSMMSDILLHLPLKEQPYISDFVKRLPGGLKLYAYYVVAHSFYLQGEHGRSLGIAEAALGMTTATYPISEIYLHLICAMNLMTLRRPDEGRAHFMKAWELAQPDGLYEAFGEHHGLLQGLVEICLKDECPEEYAKCIDITYRFSKGWRTVHNPDAHEEVADVLSTTEFSISMLASKGWSNREIAAHMGLSLDTVKRHLSSSYQKLGVTNRKELAQYMLK